MAKTVYMIWRHGLRCFCSRGAPIRVITEAVVADEWLRFLLFQETALKAAALETGLSNTECDADN